MGAGDLTQRCQQFWPQKNCYCEEGIPISDGSGEEGTLLVQASAWDEGELLMMSTWGILRHALQGAGQAVQSMLVVTVT